MGIGTESCRPQPCYLVRGRSFRADVRSDFDRQIFVLLCLTEHHQHMTLTRCLLPLCLFIGWESLPHQAIFLSAAEAPCAARSVHLGWPAPDADWFSLEMVVRESVPGSYFMACGWNTGYFGIQELAKDRKVVIFSVWDPTRGDDPTEVAVEDRVELMSHRSDARIRRFGGEGTGGQCMAACDWSIGKPMRFLLRASVQGEKTEYAGYLFDGASSEWQQLVAFRVRTGGLPLRGLYSFVEDFRRDTASAQQVRSAEYGNGWVRTTDGDWVSLRKARFTASGADWEARDTINADVLQDRFRLFTGGLTQQTTPLRSILSLPPTDTESHPPADLVDFVRSQQSP